VFRLPLVWSHVERIGKGLRVGTCQYGDWWSRVYDSMGTRGLEPGLGTVFRDQGLIYR
jgi:hypothetical protein